MISKKTAFIIGAGGSVPYGLPVGIKLRDIILCDTFPIEFTIAPKFLKNNNLSDYGIEEKLFTREMIIGNDDLRYNNIRRDVYRYIWSPRNHPIESNITFFHNAFDGSGVSIDVFLERNSDYLEYGKLAIAQALLYLEDPSNVINKRHESWLDFIWGEMIRDSNKLNFIDNNVVFITFNYDRIIEFYLFKRMKSMFQYSDNEIRDILNRFGIYHIHGNLGPLKYKGSDKNQEIPFGIKGMNPEEKWNLIYKASKNINIYNEVSEDKSSEIKEILGTCERIYILGYAFESSNNKKIFNASIDYSTKIIRASGYNFTNEYCLGVIRNLLKINKRLIGLSKFPNETCWGFLNNYYIIN